MNNYHDRSGIYWLTFTKEGSDETFYYVGQTCQLSLRRRQHEALCKAVCSHNNWINALILDGYSMKFDEFMACDVDSLHEEEKNTMMVFIQTHGEDKVVNKLLWDNTRGQYFNPHYKKYNTIYRNNVGFTGFNNDELNRYFD